MTRKDIIERILERIEKHRQENYSRNECVFFFTSQWPYKELNKMFKDCGINYNWSSDKSYLTLDWDELGYKKFTNKVDEFKLKEDFE